MYDADADAVASAVLAKFNALPTKAKPRVLPNGLREWTPLSGIVLSYDTEEGRQHDCVALGTGMKCLPAAKLPVVHGNCLHDCHAEIVAIRSFNLFLFDECQMLLEESGRFSKFVQRNPKYNSDCLDYVIPHFTLRPGIEISLYCSEAPCGDASMELIMSKQEDARPWQDDSDAATLMGRRYFSKLGVVRRKPARGDAPSALSKSCSDKLALKQATSLLSAFTSLFIVPGSVYLSWIVVPEHRLLSQSFVRAFGESGRMSCVHRDAEAFTGQYILNHFKWASTMQSFDFERVLADSTQIAQGSNISTSWTPSHLEMLVGGTKMGRKQADRRGASRISRRNLWALSLQLALSLDQTQLIDTFQKTSYAEVKASALFRDRRAVQQYMKSTALTNWIANVGDDDWQLNDSK